MTTYWFELVKPDFAVTNLTIYRVFSPNPLKRVEVFKTTHSLCSLLQDFANLTSLASAAKLFVINMSASSICEINLKQQLSGEKCRQNLHHRTRHVHDKTAFESPIIICTNTVSSYSTVRTCLLTSAYHRCVWVLWRVSIIYSFPFKIMWYKCNIHCLMLSESQYAGAN